MKPTPLAVISTLFLTPSSFSQDYKGYDQLLSKYVKSEGVLYKAWATNDTDHEKLDEILNEWAKIDATKLGENNRAAFRINLYNAAMISVALDKYPLKSVTKIGVPFSVFKRRFIQTPQGNVSLDNIEKKQLIKDFPDARIHFAVNCASVSCPPLRDEAYTGKKIDKQLAEQAKKFVNSPHAVHVSGNTVSYSSLFKWYKDDFGGNGPSQIISKYGGRKVDSELKIKWIKYDWSLNESRSIPLTSSK